MSEVAFTGRPVEDLPGVRALLAKAWEEGWRRGVTDASESTDAWNTINPYDNGALEASKGRTS